MPSLIHEALVDLFRSCPTLAARLLAARRAIPSADEVEGELVSEDLSLVASPEYRADAVLRLRGPGVDLALVAEAVGQAAAQAARDLDEQRSRLYVDLIMAALHPAARVFLERLMIQNWEPQSDLFKRLIGEGRTQGLAEGERRLLERMLTRRFGPLPDEVHRRIEEAAEDQLLQWSDEVLSAPSLEAIFGPT